MQLIHRVKKHHLLAVQLAALCVVVSFFLIYNKHHHHEDFHESNTLAQEDDDNGFNTTLFRDISSEEEWHNTNSVLIGSNGVENLDSDQRNQSFHAPLLVAEAWNPYNRNPACSNFSLRKADVFLCVQSTKCNGQFGI